MLLSQMLVDVELGTLGKNLTIQLILPLCFYVLWI